MSKIIRGSFLGRDPLSIKYVKSLKEDYSKLSDNECINIITEFNKHGLDQKVFCSVLKGLSNSLKSFISGTVPSLPQNRGELAEKIIAEIEANGAHIEHKHNTKGKKTKVYKAYLKTLEIQSQNIRSLTDLFFESGSGFFDLSEKNKKNMLIILFSVTNYSRLLTSKVDLYDPVVRDGLLASIVGENSEKLSKSEISEIFGKDLEEVLKDWFQIFEAGTYPSSYNLQTDMDNIYISNKAGPNGPNSLLYAGIDAVAISENLELYDSLSS